MRHSEIRDVFFSYFSKKGHHKVLSSPLIPAKDPTLLFTNAGMNQFKSVFLQEETREYKRAAGIQKCMRVSGKHNDFDEVGKSEYHHTFFEMLGNFSFGDYFKEKAIEYGWELLTDYYKFDPEKLWITVFREDDEAFTLWEKNIGIPAHKIIRCGEKDNFWQMGETGPCGPCSEIHYDRGESYGPAEFSDGNKRYVEIWNLVFMQYDRDRQGNLNPLPAPSIDTGMGMERLTSLLQGVESNYGTDLFQPIINFTAELAGIDPQSGRRPQPMNGGETISSREKDIAKKQDFSPSTAQESANQVDLNVIADHTRALTFLISDGVLPANDGRGYVLRRLLRRAAKHGKTLGFSGNFLDKVSAKVIEVMKDFYPELEYNRNFIADVLRAEEERFNHTLLNGLKRFEDLLEKAAAGEQKIIPGVELFKLSDTYGFPLDFAVDLANEKDIAVDHKGFRRELEKQRERSRLSLDQKQKSTRALEKIDNYETLFTGYGNLEEEAAVQAIYKDGRPVSAAAAEEEAMLVFDRSPFYAESGGQVGDVGVGRSDNVFFEITGTKKAFTGDKGAFLHYAKIKKGELHSGDRVVLTVDKEKRGETEVHHSSTHLLHAALREVLGLHVKQAGSYVGPDKLRFDFTHFKPLTGEEIEKVETIVNRKVRENLPIKADTVKYEDAIAGGAMAIFEEKYSDVVRLVSMSDFSGELCGGTHLSSTGRIGFFKIVKESSISAGIRRIEAVAGAAGYRYTRENLGILAGIQEHFKQKQENLLSYLIEMGKEIKEKEKLLKKKKETGTKIDIDKILAGGISVKGISTVTAHIESIDRKQLSALADEIKSKAKGTAVLSTNIDGKSAFIVSVFPGLTKQLHAGKIVKEIAKTVNGNGGGRPDFAQAGGENIKNVEKFKKDVIIIIEKFLQG